MNLARAKRKLRGLPTRLVVADLDEMRDVYRAINELGAEGEKFLVMTTRMAKRSDPAEQQRSRDPRVKGARIFEDAFDGVVTKSEAWKRFAEAEKKLREDADEGRRSEDDVQRDIENLRDLLTRKLEENEE